MAETQPESIGRKIRAAREASGLTLAQIAERLGVTGATVGDVERGRKSVTLENAIEYAKAIEIDPSILDVRLAGRAALAEAKRQKKWVLTRARAVAQELKDAGRTTDYKAIAALIGSVRVVDPVERRKRPNLTPKVPEKLYQQYLAKEIKIEEFAKILGITVASLYARMRSHGLAARNPHGSRKPAEQTTKERGEA